MAGSSTHEVTKLLQAWSDGDRDALEQLTPIIHAELRKIAKRYMRGERKNHTLQTTALVNETFIRLIDWKSAKWKNRAHFFGVSANIMRRILVDFARRFPKLDGKKVQYVSFEKALEVSKNHDADLLALDEALTELAEYDKRKAKIVELRFFGGLTVDETAEVLQVSPVTVAREWRKAKAWLYQELSD